MHLNQRDRRRGHAAWEKDAIHSGNEAGTFHSSLQDERRSLRKILTMIVTYVAAIAHHAIPTVNSVPVVFANKASASFSKVKEEQLVVR